MRDLEPTKRTDPEALRCSEASFRTLLEGNPDAVFVYREHTVLFANPAAIALLGHQREEDLRGRKDEELLMPGEKDALAEPHQPGARRVVFFRHRRGHLVPCEVVTLSISFDGQPAVVSIARDLTKDSQVWEKSSVMVTGMVHELNNPLAYVMSNLTFAQNELGEQTERGKPLSDEQMREVREAQREAIEGGELMRRILREWMSLSRPEEEPLCPVDIHAVLDSCASLAQGKYLHVQLVKEYGEIPRVLGKESRLIWLFRTLIGNAARASSEGDAKDHGVHLTTALAEKGWVVVSVRDTGRALWRLFEPISSNKALGLVAAGLHLIVREMGGRIEVSSEFGMGTTFRVFLLSAR
jgi:PAS domain S-box-containing protein